MNTTPSVDEPASRLKAGKGARKGASQTPDETKGELSLRSDWARLPGHTVEVWLLGQRIDSGVVEQAAEDHSVLWLAGAGANTRRLFDKPTGYQIWV